LAEVPGATLATCQKARAAILPFHVNGFHAHFASNATISLTGYYPFSPSFSKIVLQLWYAGEADFVTKKGVFEKSAKASFQTRPNSIYFIT